MTDPRRIHNPLEIIEQLPDDIGVIFRHFGDKAEIRMTPDIANLCQRQNRVLLIAADAQLAKAVGAAGVHWPARLSGQAAYGRFAGAIHTMSAHSLRDIRIAEKTGMDGVILSAVFASDSPTAPAAMGMSRLAAHQEQTRLAVYGLGGIGSRNVERVSRIAGFAAVSGFSELVADD